jgi:hypothetical protein
MPDVPEDPVCSSFPSGAQSFFIGVTMADGRDACDVETGGPDDTSAVFTIEGAVVASIWDTSSATWTIDTCAPGDACTPQRTTIHLKGTDLAARISVGTLVHVDLRRFPPNAADSRCGLDLQIRNLATWGGVTNPIATDGKPWFMGTDHGFGDWRNLIVSLFDYPCEDPDVGATYAGFAWKDALGAEIVVLPMKTADWNVPVGRMAGQWRVRNDRVVREYAGLVESYWVARAPVP